MIKNVMYLIILLFYSCMPPFIPTSQNYVDNTYVSNFFSNVQYGSTNKEVMDIFLPTATAPTGVVFYFHGGGFVQGSKDGYYSDVEQVDFIEKMLSNQIAFVNVNYELLDINREQQGVSKSLKSAEKSLQHIIYFAEHYNIDPTKVVLTGSSAGSGIALYLSYRSNPYTTILNPNALLNSYTDIKACAVQIPQATYNLQRWDEVFTALSYDGELDYNTNQGTRDLYNRFYGVKRYTDPTAQDLTFADFIERIDEGHGVDTRIVSDNTFYNTVVNNTIQDISHNAYHGEILRTKLLAGGIEVRSNIAGLSGDNLQEETLSQYVIRKINE